MAVTCSIREPVIRARADSRPIDARKWIARWRNFPRSAPAPATYRICIGVCRRSTPGDRDRIDAMKSVDERTDCERHVRDSPTSVRACGGSLDCRNESAERSGARASASSTTQFTHPSRAPFCQFSPLPRCERRGREESRPARPSARLLCRTPSPFSLTIHLRSTGRSAPTSSKGSRAHDKQVYFQPCCSGGVGRHTEKRWTVSVNTRTATSEDSVSTTKTPP